MRWLFGVLVVTAGIAAAVLAGAFYLLRPVSTVTASVAIDRPPSIIYPLLINLKTFNEYSPWVAADPQAQYVFQGPPEGVGQIERWDSSAPELGQGGMVIVKTVDDREVDAKVLFGASPIPFTRPPRAKSQFTIADGERGAKVTWTLSSACAPDAVAAPCRLANFIAQLGAAQRMNAALIKLKALAEQLPALDISDLKPERTTLASLDFAFVEGDEPQTTDQFRAALRQDFGAVDAYLKKNGLQPSGAPMAVMARAPDGHQMIHVGRPFSGGVGPGAGAGVQIGHTPGGPVLKLLYTGDYAAMRPTYAKLDAYIHAHRIKAAGDPWEVYVDNPDKTPADQLRTEIYFPIQ